MRLRQIRTRLEDLALTATPSIAIQAIQQLEHLDERYPPEPEREEHEFSRLPPDQLDAIVKAILESGGGRVEPIDRIYEEIRNDPREVRLQERESAISERERRVEERESQLDKTFGFFETGSTTPAPPAQPPTMPMQTPRPKYGEPF